MTKQASVFLVLTSALVIKGAICRAGTLVEVTEAQAVNFLQRGKARLATEKDGAPAAEAASDEEIDLSRCNKAELLQFCADNGFEVDESMTKAEILKHIEQTAG